MRKSSLKRFYFFLIIALLLTLLAALGPILTPMDPNEINLNKILHPPDRNNIFGTDRLGRDVLSRILYGSHNSFILPMAVVLFTACIGMSIGMTAGYLGGALDTIAMQIADMLLAFPAVVFVIAITGIWGIGVNHTLTSLAVISWAKYARLTRMLVADIRQREYITHALFSGARWYQVILNYIIPNIIPQLLIMAILDVGEMILTISALSFLGLVGRTTTPEWGRMLAENRGSIMTRPYLMIFPALVLAVTIIIFNMLGDSLRDLLDPREG